jgi:hydrogenase expression/formation protein HypC
MCVAIPARVVSLGDAIAGSRPGKVEVHGVEREVDLVMVPGVGVGDYVVIHSGFAIRVIPENRALETIQMLEESIDSRPTTPRLRADKAPDPN